MATHRQGRMIGWREEGSLGNGLGNQFARKSICCLFIIFFLHACRTTTSFSHIAYSSKQFKEGKSHIFLMKINGTSKSQLITGLVAETCPVWSPDGQKLMFISVDDRENITFQRKMNLYTINKDSSNLIQLTHDEMEIYSAAWSPNGSRIVFSASPDRNFIHIYTMNADGSSVIQLTNDKSWDFDPKWSHDAKRITFSSNGNYGHGENPYFYIFIMNADGSGRKQLTDERERDYGPVWSPDGQHIVFYTMFEDHSASEGGIWNNANIYMMDENGSNKRTITISPKPVQNISPSLSPDSHRIAFASNRDHIETPDVFDIYVMNADGSNIVRLTTSGNNSCPAWGP